MLAKLKNEMEVQQFKNQINSKPPQNQSFGSLFRINLYNFEKANKAISKEILGDELCLKGKIKLNGKNYSAQKILDLFTYFICEDEHDQHFIDKLEKLGLKFDYIDRKDLYRSIIDTSTTISGKISGHIKLLKRSK